MTYKEDWRIHTHLSEEMAKALVAAQSEVYGDSQLENEIIVTKEGVAMTPSGAFDLLYVYNRALREAVIDAFIDIAQEKYLEFHKVDPDDDHELYLEGGIDFENGMITVSRS